MAFKTDCGGAAMTIEAKLRADTVRVETDSPPALLCKPINRLQLRHNLPRYEPLHFGCPLPMSG